MPNYFYSDLDQFRYLIGDKEVDRESNLVQRILDLFDLPLGGGPDRCESESGIPMSLCRPPTDPPESEPAPPYDSGDGRDDPSRFGVQLHRQIPCTKHSDSVPG